ncbi:MAG TPA: tetratricopeptide repeat protein [Bacteroidia bacterium]|nr:tetratricopeptide repeat protein [Bacteroidia bacterium]
MAPGKTPRPFFTRLFLVLALLLAGINAPAQKNKADSLAPLLKKNPGDRVIRKNFISALRKMDADSALVFGVRAANDAEQKDDKIAAGDWNLYNASTLDVLNRKKEAETSATKAYGLLKAAGDTMNLDDCANTLGYIKVRAGNFKEAKTYLEEALSLREASADTAGLAGTLMNLGLLYGAMGDYNSSLDYYFKAVEYARPIEKKDPVYMGKILNNIGSIYMNQKKYDDALQFLRQALSYKIKAGNKSDMASTYNNIGSCFMEEHVNDSALYYFGLALDIRKEAKDVRGEAIVHNNFGQVYENQGQFKKAEAEFRTALSLRETLPNQDDIASSLVSLSEVLLKMNRAAEALPLARRSYELALQNRSLTQMLESNLCLFKVLVANGNYQEASKYAQQGLDLKDSIQNDVTDKHAQEMKARYDMEGQTREIEKLKSKKREDDLRNATERKMLLTILLSGGVLVLLTGFFFWFRHRENQRSRKVLQMAYDQIETKNRNITDSITYARQIQLAILPEEKQLRQLFPGSFVFYKPKDIVSGDFYWVSATEGKRWIAVADCTGHGVPGAFMSVLGSTHLSAAVAENPAGPLSLILDNLDKEIRRQLHQDSGISRDGMDIALCCYEPSTGVLAFAGANRPMIVLRRDGSMEIFRPVKTSIGGMIAGTEKKFTETQIRLLPGDTFYLFSDGFPDQFGSPEGSSGNHSLNGMLKGKKFKSSRFRSLITSVRSLEPEEQKKEIERTFLSWKGDLEQVDDVCVIGVRV